MAQVQEKATRAVSAALANVEGDLISVIDAEQERWQQELSTAKATARKLLASVLSERESLRTSLGTAAELWRILKPSAAQTLDKKTGSPATGLSSFLADDEQISKVRSLQSVSHTIFYFEFIMAAPGAIERARKSLSRLLEDGLDQVVPGNAAMLVEAHGILTAVERLRDLILLESPDLDDTDASLSWFSDAAETRNALEDIVIRDIFSDVVHVSQQNPRLLVAAARIIESEETEDKWWNNHLQRGGHGEQGGVVRPFGAQDYRNRALESVMNSIRSLFYEKERELGLDEVESGIEGSSSPRARGASIEVVNILDWIDHRRSENETVRRFVVPCLPPSFCISSSYEKELHRQFMRLITRLLHLVHPDGSMLLSEADLISLTSWYCKYQEEGGDHEEAIDSFLSESDRERLISALQKHCAARISAKMISAIALDRNTPPVVIEDGNTQHQDENDPHVTSDAKLQRSDLPDIVLGCINEQVRRMLALQIKGMDQAIAETAADCLMAFQKEIRQAMATEATDSAEEDYRLYACTTANNMARCLEYSEDLRDLFIPLASDRDRSDIEERMERVIEGFRSCASLALKVLINGVDACLKTHATRLYAPHTGTEIMLDIVATLEDYFSDYEAYLLPYHFEHLAIESLKRVVVWYVAPFLRVAQDRMEESAARRFTSLPTFDEMNSMTVDIPPEDCDASLFGRQNTSSRVETTAVHGLRSLNGAAVVAQIDKDRANLTEFMTKKVVLYQKKQLQPTLEPLQAIRLLYTCPSTTFGLSDAFREARAVLGRALRSPWVSECGLSGHVSFRMAEVIWESRKDVNPVVLLEAVSLIRSLGDKPDRSSLKESRMSSFDDGRFLGSKHLDLSGPFSERLLGNDLSYEQATSSSSLLWAPSTSRSSLSRRR